MHSATICRRMVKQNTKSTQIMKYNEISKLNYIYIYIYICMYIYIYIYISVSLSLYNNMRKIYRRMVTCSSSPTTAASWPVQPARQTARQPARKHLYGGLTTISPTIINKQH